MPKSEIRPIFVRLTEAERRRIRTLAVSQGLTMRQAIVQAFEAWAAQLRSEAKVSTSAGTAASRPSVGGRPKKDRQPEYASASQPVPRRADLMPAETNPSLAGGGSFPGLDSLPKDWPVRAAQLDWSKCPAAESAQTKRGTIWVAAGTLHPLIHVFEAVAGDNPLTQIVEVYELTLPQLMTLLQFAAAGVASSASGRD